jgi:diguanylate cyclase
MRITKATVFVFGFYLALIILWFSASLFDAGSYPFSFSTIFAGFKHNQTYGYIFNFAYSFLPLYVGIYGFRIAGKWGMFKSTMGKAIINLSLSLIFWGIGEIMWAYYNFFLGSNIPYPSWDDVAYVLTYPFLAVGLIYLGRATGVKFGLRNVLGKVYLILAPIAILIFSWYILVQLGRGGSITSGGGPLTVFFDIAYPVGDVIILVMVIIIYGLSFRFLGGMFKWPILITLIGVLLEYIADFGFSYTTTINTYYNGNWVDLVYLTSLLLMSFGVTLLDVEKTNKE